MSNSMSNWVIFLTIVHTVLSMTALLLGLWAVCQRAFGERRDARETAFLDTAAAATISGFLLPFHGVTPAIAVGMVSCSVLIATLVARANLAKPTRGWWVTFVVGVVLSEYLLCFVAVAQAFGKIPALHRLAPTLKEPPFGMAQAIVLIIFLILAASSVRRSSLDKPVSNA